jgi:hypothetical protein
MMRFYVDGTKSAGFVGTKTNRGYFAAIEEARVSHG